MTEIVDESRRSILRKEFYMDGLNCDPVSFDKECELTNAHFTKMRNVKISKVTTTLSATFQLMLRQKIISLRKNSAWLRKREQMIFGG